MIAVGTLAWLVVTVVVAVGDDRYRSALPTCWAGLALGVAGALLYLVQRRAARRGRRTAQRGL